MPKKGATRKVVKKNAKKDRSVSISELKPERPQNKHLKPFKKGQSGNPKGRPKGRRDYATVFRIALEQAAKKAGMSSEELEEKLMVKRIQMSLSGDHRYDKDMLDRLYGKAQESIDHTSNGESIGNATLIYNTPEDGDTDQTGK